VQGDADGADVNQQSAGYLKPDDPSFDGRLLRADRRHLSTVTLLRDARAGNQLAARAVSHWRASGIVSARSGDRLNIRPTDIALTGSGQPATTSSGRKGERRLHQKTLTNWFNARRSRSRARHARQPARNAVVGPAYWNIDLAVSKLLATIGYAQTGAAPRIVQF